MFESMGRIEDGSAIADVITRERERQEHGIELIASENFVSPPSLRHGISVDQ